jgi:hypothetical protein
MKSINQLIEEQVRRWEILKQEKPEEKTLPVITDPEAGKT